MTVNRQDYLNRLINRRLNGMVKVITGLRRSGKSFLLFNLYRSYLTSIGVDDAHIIEVALDDADNYVYHNPRKLLKYIRSKIVDSAEYYIFIDEIQFVKSIKVKDPEIKNPESITFYSVVNALLKLRNVDVYVTGSNSRMLSKDVMTEFRGRGDEVRVRPFSFAEFMSAYDGDVRDGWDEYLEYGGMPLAVMAKGHEAKSRYLKNLFEETYLRDVVERYRIRKPEALNDVVNVLASSVGSLTNPERLANTFRTVKRESILPKTIGAYIKKLSDSFLVDGVRRFDIKGRKYIASTLKYYFADVGLRNARLGFRQNEPTHLMENVIYNELVTRGYDVDVGVVELFGKDERGNGLKKQITEKEKSSVVFSSLFLRHYPKLYEQLHDIMWSYHKGNGMVYHTKDYWVRDFMPVQVAEDVFVKFTFNPDYLQDKKKYITDVDKVIKHCPFAQEYKIVNLPIILDGGNLVFCIGYDCLDETAFVVMTEKVLYENPKLCKEQIEMLFKYAFQEPYLIIVWLPWDKEDTFGHTDGIVRYVGYNALGRPKVLVNFELYDEEIAEQMYDALSEHFDVIELKLSEYDELSWAYINCLQTQDFIIIPGIGNATTDAEAIKQYRELFPEYEDNIFMVQMREFIEEHGGALNCLTWTIQENYLKMLCKGAHIPLVGFEDSKDCPPYQEEIDKLFNNMLQL